MRDIMMDAYNVLIADEFIQSQIDINKNIKFYEYPENSTLNEPYIVIDEIDDPLPVEYADNEWMANSEIIEINVYTKDKTGINARIQCKEINNRIKEIIWDELGMYNTSNSKPEYDRDFKLYRRASRYEGAFYREQTIN